MDQDEIWYGGRSRASDIVLDGGSAPPPTKGARPPIFGRCLLWPNGRPSQLLLSSCSKLRLSAILCFKNLEIFTVGGVKTAEMHFSKRRPSTILDFLYACLDHLRRGFGDIYHCAEFGWDRCNSFNNMQVLIFYVFG